MPKTDKIPTQTYLTPEDREWLDILSAASGVSASKYLELVWKDHVKHLDKDKKKLVLKWWQEQSEIQERRESLVSGLKRTGTEG